jgi:hypothetical protein
VATVDELGIGAVEASAAPPQPLTSAMTAAARTNRINVGTIRSSRILLVLDGESEPAMRSELNLIHR